MGFKKNDPRLNRNGAPLGPRRKPVTDMFRYELSRRITDETGNLRVGANWIVQSGIRRAIEGDVQWARLLFEYAYGKPTPMADPGADRKMLESEIVARWVSALPTEALVVIKRLTESDRAAIDARDESEIIDELPALPTEGEDDQ
jgi:hypothetical protein